VAVSGFPQNVIKLTPALSNKYVMKLTPALFKKWGREREIGREGGEGGICYNIDKTFSITNKRPASWLRLALCQTVIKLTPAPAGSEREGEGGRRRREACIVAAKML